MANVQAMSALEFAVGYRQRWGVKREGNAPGLPPRIEYAVRRVGGLEHLDEHRREFVQAYAEASVVDGEERLGRKADEEAEAIEVRDMQVGVPGDPAGVFDGEEPGEGINEILPGSVPDLRVEETAEGDAAAEFVEGTALRQAGGGAVEEKTSRFWSGMIAAIVFLLALAFVAGVVITYLSSRGMR